MDENKIIIADEKGNEVVFNILFTYENEERGKSYVFVYKDNEEDNVMAFIYNELTKEIQEIEDDEEYEEVEEVFNAYNEDPEIQKLKED